MSADVQRQETATAVGMSVIGFESSWWGNELLGQHVDEVWAVIDDMSADGLHIAVAYMGGEPPEEMRPYDDDWVTDEWIPKSKSEILVSPDWTRFEGKNTRRGTVYAALKVRTEYGRKVLLWGDTYEAVSKDGANALDGTWDRLHPNFNGNWWSVDEVNGVLITSITDAGYDLRVSDGLTD